MRTKGDRKQKTHLAIFKSSVAESILTGKKTIETRFSLHKISPFGNISVDDIVYIKPPGKEIIGRFRVKKVFYYQGLEAKDIDKLFEDYGDQIASDDQQNDKNYRLTKKNSKFGTVIFIKESERLITSPIRFKKSDLRGWVVLD